MERGVVLQERRDLVIERTNRTRGLSAVRPSGTFYVCINCGGWIGKTTLGGRCLVSDVDVVDALLDEGAVATVPGQVFGLSPFFRVSYSLELALPKEGMDRIEKFSHGLQ